MLSVYVYGYNMNAFYKAIQCDFCPARLYAISPYIIYCFSRNL